MTSQQLESFMAVARYLSYRKAAEVLFITQPAITKQVILLERELGFDLFVRSKREVALTPIGELFYSFAQQIMEQFSDFHMKARALQEANALKVCMQMNSRSQLITDAVAEFIKQHPSVTVRFEFCDIADLPNAVAQRHYDLYISNMEELAATFSSLDYIELETIGFSFLAKRGFMGITEPPSSLSVYNGCDFIDPYYVPDYTSAFGKRAALPPDFRKGLINNLGLFPEKILSVPNWQSVLASVSLGTGMTLISTDVEIDNPENYIFFPTRKTSPLFALWHTDNQNPALVDLLNLIQENPAV